MILFLIILMALMPVALYFGLRRIDAVCNHRTLTVDRITAANRQTIRAVKTESELLKVNDVCEERWRWLHSVTFDEMVWRFWRPLNSFYGPMPNEPEEWPDVIEREWNTPEEDAAWRYL